MARKECRIERREEATRVDGRILWPNLMKPISMAGGAFAMATVCVCLACFCAGFGGGVFAAAKLIGYAVFLTIYALVSLGILAFLLVRMRRLIIAEDRLQLLSDIGRIIGQLPYDNIMTIEMKGDRLEILLDTRKRKDTWWPRWDDRDCDVVLNAGFETDITALHLYVRDAVRAHRQKHGGRSWQR